jgi:enoyl-CoA hydratase
MSDLILREHIGGVLTLTLNRPEKRNALNTPLRQAIVAALDEATDNSSVRVVIITGVDDKSFVAGADISEFGGRTAIDQYRAMRAGNVFEAVDKFPKPIIAAINGYCFGGGLELALACDIRIAASSAKFGQPEVNLGLIPGGGGTQRLPRIIGPGAALKLVLTGLPIDAEEAFRLRLVDEVATPELLSARTLALADRIATRGPIAVCAAKEAIRAAQSIPLQEGLHMESALFQLCFSSADKIEGVQAFLEKREPTFRSR